MLGWEKGEWSQKGREKATRKNGGSSTKYQRRWVVHFIRDSEYKISGIKKLANKYARLDSFLVCPENLISVQLRLLQSLYFSSKHSRSALPFTP